MSKYVHCPECQKWLREDALTGMRYCPNWPENCKVAGNLLTKDEVRVLERLEVSDV